MEINLKSFLPLLNPERMECLVKRSIGPDRGIVISFPDIYRGSYQSRVSTFDFFLLVEVGKGHRDRFLFPLKRSNRTRPILLLLELFSSPFPVPRGIMDVYSSWHSGAPPPSFKRMSPFPWNRGKVEKGFHLGDKKERRSFGESCVITSQRTVTDRGQIIKKRDLKLEIVEEGFMHNGCLIDPYIIFLDH